MQGVGPNAARAASSRQSRRCYNRELDKGTEAPADPVFRIRVWAQATEVDTVIL